MKSLKNVPRLHTILEIRKLLYQTYVLSSPCKIDIASRRFCSQLMVGSRSQCQVQRKATKGKPALPTPVRHTEGAKCCFERFIIETITYDIVSQTWPNTAKYAKYGIWGAYLGTTNMVKWGIPEKTLQSAVQKG